MAQKQRRGDPRTTTRRTKQRWTWWSYTIECRHETNLEKPIHDDERWNFSRCNPIHDGLPTRWKSRRTTLVEPSENHLPSRYLVEHPHLIRTPVETLLIASESTEPRTLKVALERSIYLCVRSKNIISGGTAKNCCVVYEAIIEEARSPTLL